MSSTPRRRTVTSSSPSGRTRAPMRVSSVRSDAAWLLPPARLVGGADRLVAHHPLEVLHEEGDDRRLRGREVHPPTPHPQQTLVVDRRDAGARRRAPAPAARGSGPGGRRGRAGCGPSPRARRAAPAGVPRLDEEDPRLSEGGEVLPDVRIVGPVEHGHAERRTRLGVGGGHPRTVATRSCPCRGRCPAVTGGRQVPDATSDAPWLNWGRSGGGGGGERGIRTHGDPKATTVFETVPFVRSGSSPPATLSAALRRSYGGCGPPVGEEPVEERGGLLGPDAGDDLHLVVEAGVDAEVVERPAGAVVGVGGAEHHPARPGRRRRAPAHIGHGSRVTTRVAPSSRQRASLGGGGPQGEHLGVGGGVVVALPPVAGAGHDARRRSARPRRSGPRRPAPACSASSRATAIAASSSTCGPYRQEISARSHRPRSPPESAAEGMIVLVTSERPRPA